MKYNFIIFLILLPAGSCLKPQVEAILEERKRLKLLNHQSVKESEFLEPTPLIDTKNNSISVYREFRQGNQSGDAPDCYTKTAHISSTNAKKFYFRTCPELEYAQYGTPCPSEYDTWVKDKSKYTGVSRDSQGRATLYHYWFYKVQPDTLYDLIPMHKKIGQTKMLRFHMCSKAKPLKNLRVQAYGLGWVYLVWSQPRENCLCVYGFHIKYEVPDRTKETFKSKRIGETNKGGGWYEYSKFIVCPTYPNDFCFVLSENVAPMAEMNIEVMYYRFNYAKEGDHSNWTGDRFRTDDRGMGWGLCPPENILGTLWFAILLGACLFFLLVTALILYILVKKLKKENDLKKDEDWYEQEKIPPRSNMHKVWERLRNFFKELCPTPQPPPPPPPPPPPSARKSLRMERRKSRRESKLKKIKPKPPLPPPEPKPPPPPPPPPRRRRKPPPPPAPPPVPPPRTRKPRRTMKAPEEGRKSIMKSYLDTKKAASAVGGTGRRPRPRRR